MGITCTNTKLLMAILLLNILSILVFIFYNIHLSGIKLTDYNLFGSGAINPLWTQSTFGNNCVNCIPTQRVNASYDRERNCLSRTYAYEAPLQWEKFTDPIIVWQWNYSSNYMDINPDYSIIITVYDTLHVADRVIESILKLTRGKYEVIVVLDDVDDETVTNITQLIQNFNHECSLMAFKSINSTVFIENQANVYLAQKTLIYDYCVNHKQRAEWHYKCGMIQRIVLVRAWGIWETSSNNLGMCLSSKNTKYFIHIQDDMQMTQIGWNINIVLPLSIFNGDIFSVSARCANGIQRAFQGKKGVITTSVWRKMDDKIARSHGVIREATNGHSYNPAPIGRCGANINNPLDFTKYPKSRVYERSNSNRGPYAINASNMRDLQFWNERSFKLGFDIPELHLRAMTYLHKHSAFFPLQFRADLSWGGTRRKRRNRTDAEKALAKEYELWRNHRRDVINAFKLAGENRTYADYSGIREITFKMIEANDALNHLCD